MPAPLDPDTPQTPGQTPAPKGLYTVIGNTSTHCTATPEQGNFAGNVLASSMEVDTGHFLVCLDGMGREGQGKAGRG